MAEESQRIGKIHRPLPGPGRRRLLVEFPQDSEMNIWRAEPRDYCGNVRRNLLERFGSLSFDRCVIVIGVMSTYLRLLGQPENLFLVNSAGSLCETISGAASNRQADSLFLTES